MLSDETLDIVLLDEMTYMVKYGYIELDDIIDALNNRPKCNMCLLPVVLAIVNSLSWQIRYQKYNQSNMLLKRELKHKKNLIGDR
jgi:hypothetical protein